MMRFTITEIHGDQLAQEVFDALGLDISSSYAFIPPDTLEIIGFDEYTVDIGAIVAAHVPDLATTDLGQQIIKQREAVLAYNVLPFASMTPDEAAAWANAGVTDLVSAREIISQLASAVVGLSPWLTPDR